MSSEVDQTAPVGELLWKGDAIALLREDDSNFPWRKFQVVELLGPEERHESLAKSTAEVLRGQGFEACRGALGTCHAADSISFEFRWPGRPKIPVRGVLYEPESNHIRFRIAHERMQDDQE